MVPPQVILSPSESKSNIANLLYDACAKTVISTADRKCHFSKTHSVCLYRRNRAKTAGAVITLNRTTGTVTPYNAGKRVRRSCTSTTPCHPTLCSSPASWWSDRCRPADGTRPAVCLPRLRRHTPEPSCPTCSCTVKTTSTHLLFRV